MCQDPAEISQTIFTGDSSPEDKPGLSRRELQILKLLLDGLSNGEMAVELDIGIETVKTHMKNIMRKLAASGRTEAAVKAIKNDLVNFDP